MIRIGSIVLRVDDLQRQTEFWEAALGYVRRDSGESDDFVLLARPTAPGRTFRSTRFVRRSKFLRASTSTCIRTTRRARSNACSPSVRPRCTGTNGHRTRTTSSSPIPEGNRFCVVDTS